MATSITLTCLTPSDNASLMPSSGPLRTIITPTEDRRRRGIDAEEVECGAADRLRARYARPC
eukprot:6566421-Prymnesium_polylepis.1